MPATRKHESGAQRQKAYRLRQAETRIEELRVKGFPASPQIPTMPGTKRWSAMKAQAQAILLVMLLEMETYRDARSENWQESEKAEALEETMEGARGACDCLVAIC